MTSTATSETDTPTGAPAGFRAKYEGSVARNDSLLCVGLDPDPDRIPAGVDARTFLLDIIEATSDLVCCYKPNIAFYEHDVEHGLALLRDVIAAVPDGIPVLLDAKRGDIGNTARFYAKAVYESLIRAENFLEGEKKICSSENIDFDGDGENEVFALRIALLLDLALSHQLNYDF